MKIQERTPSYRRRTYGGLDDQYEGGLKQTFAAQVLICILILMFCVLVKLYPGENFERAKNSIQLIVTQNTDIKAEFEKLKANFKKDESLETLNPVSGMAAPSSGKIVKGFGIQDPPAAARWVSVAAACSGHCCGRWRPDRPSPSRCVPALRCSRRPEIRRRLPPPHRPQSCSGR